MKMVVIDDYKCSRTIIAPQQMNRYFDLVESTRITLPNLVNLSDQWAAI